MQHDLVIAGIRLGRIIGAGATGVVHAGTVLATGQEVAVKIVRPQPGQPQRLVERTVQEGRVGWAVRHPNVVRVYEWGMADAGAAYIVMERLEGETLAERLVTRGRIPADAVISIARQVTRALVAIHAEGGVHRDVKPENVFLCAAPTDRVKLLDLGIVHLGDDHPARLVRTGVGLVVGTLGYLSPEQARGGAVDRRADLYALGATLYHALVGHPPHPDGDVVEVLRYIARTETAPPLPDDVPPPLAAIVRALLAPLPDDRPPDADAVLHALDRVAPDIEDDDTGRLAPIEDPFPAMDEIADHQQIRAGIIAAVARAIRTGDGPPALSADLAALDQLKNRRRTGSARARELRRQSTALAEELDDRRRALEGTLRQLEVAQADVRERYLQSTAALMEIADSIEDIDRRYLRHYEELDALLGGDGAERASPARNVPHCLAEMEALHQSRAFFADSQVTVRDRLRTQHRALSGINLQVIEIKRELLVVEAERQATLVGLEDALRAAEDEVLQLDREIEHQFLRLGFVVQAHQAQRRKGEAAEHPALGADGPDTTPLDPVRPRPHVVGAPTDRRSADRVPADRPSIGRAGPADRPSLGRAGPADRASAAPDRRSVDRAGPADRPSIGRAGPADRPSIDRAGPAERPSIGRAAPADRPSIGRAAPADRPSIGRAGPADRASAGPTDRRSLDRAAPADRRALDRAGPADRRSLDRAGPADRASATPADRRSLDRASDRAASPARPADRASVARADRAAARVADRAALTADPTARAEATSAGPRVVDPIPALATPLTPAERAALTTARTMPVERVRPDSRAPHAGALRQLEPPASARAALSTAATRPVDPPDPARAALSSAATRPVDPPASARAALSSATTQPADPPAAPARPADRASDGRDRAAPPRPADRASDGRDRAALTRAPTGPLDRVAPSERGRSDRGAGSPGPTRASSPPAPAPAPVAVPLPSAAPVAVPLPSPAPVAVPLPSAAPVAVPLPSPAPVAVPMPSPTPVAIPIPSPTPVAIPIPSPTPVAIPIPSPAPVAIPIPSPATAAAAIPSTAAAIPNPMPHAAIIPSLAPVGSPIPSSAPHGPPIPSPLAVATAIPSPMPHAASIPSPAPAATAIPSPTPATTATPASATTPSPVPIAAMPSPAGPSPAPAPIPPAPSAAPPAIRAPRPGLALRHDDITTDPDHHLDPDDLPEPATDPDGRPPRHETDELVSPAFDPDRSPLPPPLPPEVWTSATERRSAPRVPCTLRVEVEADGERALLTTRDLSVTGIFVFAPRVRPPGARLALVLHLGRGRLSLTGRVVHALPGVGYGVRFDGPDPGLRRRIERYLSQTEDRARAD